MTPIERDEGTGKYGWVPSKPRRGRPKGSRKPRPEEISLGAGTGEERDQPPEVIVSEDAPTEVAVLASLANFLNGYDMDYIAQSALRRRGIDPETVAKGPDLYAGQVRTVMDQVNKMLNEKYLEMGRYIMGDTTSGMGSVISAMSGERDKWGQPRKD